MKKTLLAILALVQIIVGILFLSSSLTHVLANVNFDDDQENAWYGTDRSDAIISLGEVKLADPVSVEIINRDSH